jgi:16S rRNA (uracil1498-N3)-methyltransferase
VSPPLFLVEALPSDGSTAYRLDGPEGHHAATVQRLRAGESIMLGDGRGGIAAATVTAVGRGWVDCAVGARRTVDAPDPRLTVVQGVPKGERGELAIQAMTEVGVDEVVPWLATRSVAQWRGERAEKGLARWRATAREATKQARRPWLPEVVAPAATPAVTARLTSAFAVVLDEAASDRLATLSLPASGEIMIVVGPEGGIDEAELATFTGVGAVPVRLGDAILRTSTAGVAALAVVSARVGRW